MSDLTILIHVAKIGFCQWDVIENKKKKKKGKALLFDFLTPEDGNNRLSQNVGMKLSLYTV